MDANLQLIRFSASCSMSRCLKVLHTSTCWMLHFLAYSKLLTCWIHWFFTLIQKQPSYHSKTIGVKKTEKEKKNLEIYTRLIWSAVNWNQPTILHLQSSSFSAILDLIFLSQAQKQQYHADSFNAPTGIQSSIQFQANFFFTPFPHMVFHTPAALSLNLDRALITKTFDSNNHHQQQRHLIAKHE